MEDSKMRERDNIEDAKNCFAAKWKQQQVTQTNESQVESKKKCEESGDKMKKRLTNWNKRATHTHKHSEYIRF